MEVSYPTGTFFCNETFEMNSRSYIDYLISESIILPLITLNKTFGMSAYCMIVKVKLVCCLICRDEVAACIEKSYTLVSIKEAARMLFFDDEKLLAAYASKVCVLWFITIVLIRSNVYFLIIIVLKCERTDWPIESSYFQKGHKVLKINNSFVTQATEMQ